MLNVVIRNAYHAIGTNHTKEVRNDLLVCSESIIACFCNESFQVMEKGGRRKTVGGKLGSRDNVAGQILNRRIAKQMLSVFQNSETLKCIYLYLLSTMCFPPPPQEAPS